MLGLDRITFDPQIMAGQACIRGMRIPVSLVVNLVANGMCTEEILIEYPDLETEDIRQSLEYASWFARDHIFPDRCNPLHEVPRRHGHCHAHRSVVATRWARRGSSSRAGIEETA